jgi:hypothetical protein
MSFGLAKAVFGALAVGDRSRAKPTKSAILFEISGGMVDVARRRWERGRRQIIHKLCTSSWFDEVGTPPRFAGS